jgi:hypothetical protein
MLLLSSRALAIIPVFLRLTLPNETYPLAQVMKEYALVAMANFRAASLERDYVTMDEQVKKAAIFNTEYARLMSISQPPLKEAGPSIAWVPGTVTPAMPPAYVVPGRGSRGGRTADIKGGALVRVALPGASKTDPSGTTAKGDEVVTTVSTPTDEVVTEVVATETAAAESAANASWLDTTTGKLAVGVGIAAALYYGVKYSRR